MTSAWVSRPSCFRIYFLAFPIMLQCNQSTLNRNLASSKLKDFLHTAGMYSISWYNLKDIGFRYISRSILSSNISRRLFNAFLIESCACDGSCTGLLFNLLQTKQHVLQMIYWWWKTWQLGLVNWCLPLLQSLPHKSSEGSTESAVYSQNT